MRYIITLFFLCFYVTVFSQYHFPKKEYAELVLQSKLVVELLEGEGEQIEYMNKSIKEVFAKNWKDTEVLFMTQSGIDTLCAQHQNGYAILYQEDFQYAERRNGHIDQNGRFGFNIGGVGGAPVSYSAFTFSYYSAYLNIRIDGKNHFVTAVGFGNGNLTKIDHLFLYQQISMLINASAEGKKPWHFFRVKDNLEKLKSSTLVIPTFMLKEKDIDKIEKYYDYEYELVDLQTYQDIILNQEAGKSYVKIIWSRQHKMYMWVVVNASTGAILSINSFGGVYFGNQQTAKEVIKAKYLKYATSKLAQKINNRYGWKF